MAFPKVTIIGAGQVGATTAELLLIHNIADVVLIDVAEGLPQGKALDLMHMRSVHKFETVVSGTNDYADTADSHIVIVTAGLPRKPGMTRDDLLKANRAIVEEVVTKAAAVSPAAIFVCVTNPLDVMTYLTYKLTGFPPNRVLGMGGVLDSARFAYAIAEKTGADIFDIHALAIGAHGDAMVPLPRHSTVEGKPLTEILSAEEVEEVVQRTINGGAEVVGLLQTGSAFYAPAASVAAMVAAILARADETQPTCTYLAGDYGIEDVYLSVPAVLGQGGVRAVVEIDLNEEELAALQASAATVAEQLDALNLRG